MIKWLHFYYSVANLSVFEIPKSPNLRSLLAPMKIFWVLTSLWMMFFLCRYCNAKQICTNQFRTWDWNNRMSLSLPCYSDNIFVSSTNTDCKFEYGSNKSFAVTTTPPIQNKMTLNLFHGALVWQKPISKNYLLYEFLCNWDRLVTYHFENLSISIKTINCKIF